MTAEEKYIKGYLSNLIGYNLQETNVGLAYRKVLKANRYSGRSPVSFDYWFDNLYTWSN